MFETVKKIPNRSSNGQQSPSTQKKSGVSVKTKRPGDVETIKTKTPGDVEILKTKIPGDVEAVINITK